MGQQKKHARREDMILYEDKDIIDSQKMAGIAVRRARVGERCRVFMLNNHIMEQP